MALDKKGSIGILTSKLPIFVTSCEDPDNVPIRVNNSKDVINPSFEGGEMYEKLMTSLIFKVFNLSTTVSRDEF